jgi:hypothetical protein
MYEKIPEVKLYRIGLVNVIIKLFLIIPFQLDDRPIDPPPFGTLKLQHCRGLRSTAQESGA